MKKLLATALVLGAAATLSACESTSEGYHDLQPPYEQERTVGTDTTMTKKVERTYYKAQSK